MWHHNWRGGESTTYRAAALPKADGRVTIEAVTVIICGTAGTTALCTATVLLSATLTNVTLQGDLYRVGVAFSEIQHVTVALAVVFCKGAHQNSRYLYWNTWIPLLRRRWLLVHVRIPHLFYTPVGKRRATCKQFITADCQCVLIRI